MQRPRSSFQTPLDRYLKNHDDNDSGLTFIARRCLAEPFDVDAARAQLEMRLKKYSYPIAGPKRNEKTFHEILSKAEVLEELLRPETLREVQKCKLLRQIVERARQTDNAVDGESLKNLKKRISQQEKDALILEELVKRYGKKEDGETLGTKIDRELRRDLNTLLLSKKFTGSRAELLSGRIDDGRIKGRRDEDLAAKVAVYRLLRFRFRRKSRKNKLSIILLCQLAELICAPPTVTRLSSGQSLYRSLRRHSST